MKIQQTKYNRFKKRSAVYTCTDCGKKTRDTGEGEAQVELCKKCFEQAQEENRRSDSGENNK